MLTEPLKRILSGLRGLVTLGRHGREQPAPAKPASHQRIRPPASRAERLRQSLSGSPTGRFVLRATRHEQGDHHERK
jgi:hypothetical protein